MTSYLRDLLIVVGTLSAAILLGNRFMVEVRKARNAGAPWYTPYLSVPGIIILIAFCIPIIIWLFSR